VYIRRGAADQEAPAIAQARFSTVAARSISLEPDCASQQIWSANVSVGVNSDRHPTSLRLNQFETGHARGRKPWLRLQLARARGPRHSRLGRSAVRCGWAPYLDPLGQRNDAVNEAYALSPPWRIGEPHRPAIGPRVGEPPTANGNPMAGNSNQERMIKFPIRALALPAGEGRRFAAEILNKLQVKAVMMETGATLQRLCLRPAGNCFDGTELARSPCRHLHRWRRPPRHWAAVHRPLCVIAPHPPQRRVRLKGSALRPSYDLGRRDRRVGSARLSRAVSRGRHSWRASARSTSGRARLH
jgi:hypothetical protein